MTPPPPVMSHSEFTIHHTPLLSTSPGDRTTGQSICSTAIYLRLALLGEPCLSTGKSCTHSQQVIGLWTWPTLHQVQMRDAGFERDVWPEGLSAGREGGGC